MLFLLSPSKTLAEMPLPLAGAPAQPVLSAESQVLVHELRKLDADALGKLMGISEKLAQLNHRRYQDCTWPFTPENAAQAVRFFRGDVYEGLDAESFSLADMQAAQERIRILSGLYGVLKPLDLMQPYRLEMGTKLQNPRGKNLYDFWAGRITETLNAEHPDVVVNLASAEYFQAIQPERLAGKILHCTFKEQKAGKLQVIGLFAKKARGMMARYGVLNRVKNVQELQNFTEGGYRFRPELSGNSAYVFVR